VGVNVVNVLGNWGFSPIPGLRDRKALVPRSREGGNVWPSPAVRGNLARLRTFGRVPSRSTRAECVDVTGA
jgi:hypothetical protein